MGSNSKPRAVVIPSPFKQNSITNVSLGQEDLLPLITCLAFILKPFLMVFVLQISMPPKTIPSLCVALNKNFLAPFKDLLVRLRNTVSENNPPVTSIVSDPFAPFSIQAGEDVGLPVVMYAIYCECNWLHRIQATLCF